MVAFKNQVKLIELENRLLENHMAHQYVAYGKRINKLKYYLTLKIDWKENGHGFKDLWEDSKGLLNMKLKIKNKIKKND